MGSQDMHRSNGDGGDDGKARIVNAKLAAVARNSIGRLDPDDLAERIADGRGIRVRLEEDTGTAVVIYGGRDLALVDLAWLRDDSDLTIPGGEFIAELPDEVPPEWGRDDGSA
jgi:hypothetical protein